MKKLTRIFTFLLAIAMLLAMTACGAPAESTPAAKEEAAPEQAAPEAAEAAIDPLNLTFNVTLSGELLELMTNTFVEQCAELSDGAITVQVIAPGTLGSARETAEACQLNTVDMIWSCDEELDQVVGTLGWVLMPRTITSYELADQYVNSGWICDAVSELCLDAGIKVVASAENGFRVICSKGVVVDELADMNGMKIRVPEQADYVAFMEACGSLPATISANDSLVAMQQGTVDASDNSFWNFYRLGFFDIADGFTLLNYAYSTSRLVANNDWWNSLTPAQQDVITQAATEAGRVYREKMREQNDFLLAECEKAGITVVDPDEAFQAELKEVCTKLWDAKLASATDVTRPYIEKMIETFS